MKNLPTPKQYNEAYLAIGQSASIAWLPKGVREMTPIVVSPRGDTARSFSYKVYFIMDTTNIAIVIPIIYDKNGSELRNENIIMQGNGYKKWGLLIVPLDAFIHTQFFRIVPL